MKVPCNWLAEWVDVPWEPRELGSRLTMAGFELDALEYAAPPFSGVVVAEILSAERHPQADKLQVCRVAMGSGEPLQIVCGAANARAGLKTALATVGAKLPGNLDIKAAKLRGVESFGMLASAKELGLAETSSGIIELPADAPVGQPLREYLGLDEAILELNITPNRGDAMSIVGIAREVAALTGKSVTGPQGRASPLQGESRGPGFAAAGARSTGTSANLPEAGVAVGSAGAGLSAAGSRPQHGDTFPVSLDAPAACPRFVGCIIRGVNNRAAVPLWMRERLRRAGVRSISPVVDVTNYVMLELGQPMHAYDLSKLRGEIRVRLAQKGEPITLLDGKTIEVDPDVLLITDRDGPVGLAGIMGGDRTAVSPETTDVFLEVAWFAPEAMIGRSRRFGLLTDASQRFERGVDPTLQERAAERAVAILRSIAGGDAGPLTLTQSPEHQPKRPTVHLRRSQLDRLLGLSVSDDRVTKTLESLGMKVSAAGGDTGKTGRVGAVSGASAATVTGATAPAAGPQGWDVTPPPHRFDVTIEADLIEEVARIVGYDAIPEQDAAVPQSFRPLPEEHPAEQVILESLAMRGYQEAISFAFVDPALQTRLFPDQVGKVLSNPIASDLSVMRVSLWPGLLRAALENQRRQQDRIRLFEHGTCFVPADGAVQETDRIAGVACGPRLPEQWGLPKEMREPADFFDVKGDLQALFAAAGGLGHYAFEPASVADSLACLHPGRAARVLRKKPQGGAVPVGWIGELHPSLVKELDFTYTPVLFELDYQGALAVEKPQHREISRFPQVRRDLAVVVDESVSLSALAERVVLAASSLLRDLRIFDVYRGSGVEAGRKSVALGLIFQDISRTLTDDDVERLMARVVTDLRESLNARIRE